MPTLLSSCPPSCRLLVVEPNPECCEAIVTVAAWHFPQVATVEDFGAAQKTLSRGYCTAAIVEYNLPGGTGLALYEEVRRFDSSMPFILMSADLRVALSDPHFRYLRKPFDRGELSSLLRQIARVS